MGEDCSEGHIYGPPREQNCTENVPTGDTHPVRERDGQHPANDIPEDGKHENDNSPNDGQKENREDAL